MDLLERSLVFDRTICLLLDPRKRDANQDDVDLMVEIIASARDWSARIYPEAAFHVLLWGHGTARAARSLAE
jgi:hypothetical protein